MPIQGLVHQKHNLCLCFCFLLTFHEISCDDEGANGTDTELLPFIKSELIPDVLDKAPKSLLQVKFRFSGALEVGQELTPTQTMQEPEVIWEADGSDTFYTLLMTHPDAPTRKRPLFRELRNWLVVNIPGTNVSAGEVISCYAQPVPTEGTGLHRYAILLFKQPQRLDFDEPVSLAEEDPTGRFKVSTKDFAAKYNLSEPVAGTFFEAQWDESVPRLYEQLARLKASGIDFSQYQ